MADAPAPLPHIAFVPRYVSGKSAEASMAEYGITTSIKMASNECPFGPLPGVLEAVTEAVKGTNRYDEHPAFALAAAFAERVGVSADRVAVGAGSVALLEQVTLAYAGRGDEVVYPWPSFIAYPQFTHLVGATAITPTLTRHGVDVDAMLEAITDRTRLVLIANPNNPTSTALRAAELRRLVDGVPESCLIVIDEAYREFVTGVDIPDAIEMFGDRPNVAVLRTMSKAQGLAGLRVGFMVAHPTVISAVDACLIPFNVNLAAQAAAFAAFEQDDEIARRCLTITAERDSGAQLLRRMGLGVPASEGNFWWLPAGAESIRLGVELERRGIVARPMPSGVRVTVGFPEENTQFLAALASAINDDPTLTAGWELPTGDLARHTADELDRLDAVIARLGAHLDRRHPGRTAPVPGEDETWDAGQVWAHLAEFGEYWLGIVGGLLAAQSDTPVPCGRTRHDGGRIAAIEEGRAGNPAEHFLAVRKAADSLGALLAGMTVADWGRVSLHPTLGELSIDDQLKHFLTGHYEQHADQLDSIT
jgi:histidinol-phosphate aminotransferase